MQQSGLIIEAVSSLWHSPAWPAGLGHPDYVNAVIKVSSQLSAENLLQMLHDIEAQLGRERTERNAPRPIDLDIIDYAGQVKKASPTLPHPRAVDRPFVLLPLMEITPNWRHPVTNEASLEALAKLTPDDVLSHYVIERDWLK